MLYSYIQLNCAIGFFTSVLQLHVRPHEVGGNPESTGLPEYLVHPAVLAALFEECGCVLCETVPFQRYYAEMLVNFPQAEKLFRDLLMKQGFENANMTEDEWNVISYYSYLVFRKNGVPPPMQSKEKALPGEPKDGEFKIMDVEKGVERLLAWTDSPRRGK
jgi:hypothetical protein